MIVAGTGHRPDKLGGYDGNVLRHLALTAKQWLERNPAERVISGGALGWDQALALAAARLKIPLTLALPFRNFDSKWPSHSRKLLSDIIAMADTTVYVCEDGYAPWKMQQRNKYMVDNCDLVLALWNGTKGGTANCIAYADSRGKPVENLWDFYEKAYLRDNNVSV